MKYLVKIANNQYLLEKGKRFSIDKISNLELNDSFDIKDILLSYDDAGKIVFDVKGVLKAKVEKIYREKKIIVFKKRRRKDSQRKQGHRQYKMLISIN